MAADVGGSKIVLLASQAAKSQFVSSPLPAPAGACRKRVHRCLPGLHSPRSRPMRLTPKQAEKARELTYKSVWCRTVNIGIECDVTTALQVGRPPRRHHAG